MKSCYKHYLLLCQLISTKSETWEINGQSLYRSYTTILLMFSHNTMYNWCKIRNIVSPLIHSIKRE